MTAALTAVAKAVAAKVQSIEIPFDHELNRSYGDFKELLEVLDKLHIDVFGEGYAVVDLWSRNQAHYRPQVAVAIRKRFDTTDHNDADAGKPRIKVEEIDDLVGLVETLNEFWMDPDNRTITDPDWTLAWEETSIVFNPSRKMLMENHQFLGLIRITYNATKSFP
jgi:hypothetical protein